MIFKIDEIQEDNSHRWAVISCSCDLNDEIDPLLISTVASVRTAYGEEYISTLAQPDPSVAKTFDLDAITKAFRLGLPDPDKEGGKPQHLTTYRSETTELVARNALHIAHGIEFPAHPQHGKTNPNQPVLGFDGWGFLHFDKEYALVLVQVKGTEDVNTPPAVALKLAQECQKVSQQPDVICRALSVLALYLKGSPFQQVVLDMLEKIGKNTLPQIVVAPVIVRGTVSAHIDDLKPIRTVLSQMASLKGRGLTVSIGVNLSDFGRAVMLRARSTS